MLRTDSLAIEDVQVCRGNFIFGVMDLVFRRGDLHFLVDFKSNVIDDGYSPALLQANMRDHRYDLQYQLYAVALLRWLRQVHGEKFDFGRHFGGVYYLYLRGMNGADESAGVFFHRPSEAEARDSERAIERLVARGGPA
jgi:exodeoxyribonuclease V beta subunit